LIAVPCSARRPFHQILVSVFGGAPDSAIFPHIPKGTSGDREAGAIAAGVPSADVRLIRAGRCIRPARMALLDRLQIGLDS
jgi:hypothetical protein